MLIKSGVCIKSGVFIESGVFIKSGVACQYECVFIKVVWPVSMCVY